MGKYYFDLKSFLLEIANDILYVIISLIIIFCFSVFLVINIGLTLFLNGNNYFNLPGNFAILVILEIAFGYSLYLKIIKNIKIKEENKWI